MSGEQDGSQPVVRQLRGVLGKRPDDTILSLVFHGLIIAVVVVLAFDLGEMQRVASENGWHEPSAPQHVASPSRVLPSVRPAVQPDRSGRPIDDRLRETMGFELVSDGRMLLTGTIHPGTAERFAEEVAARGGYVKTIVLNSPGGSVRDALAMGRLIREKGFETMIEADGYCASSCPLVFAGGMERHALAGATVGVHQAFSAPGVIADAGQGMVEAQRISAECQRYLVEMGVDARVWMHAMETPPESLFYFKTDELTDLKLATQAG